MPGVLDIEQALLLLELEPPFDKRDVQLARRRQAKIWHPDIAPPGKQFEHERHLKAINEAADQLESLAEGSRGGRAAIHSVSAVTSSSVSTGAARIASYVRWNLYFTNVPNIAGNTDENRTAVATVPVATNST